MVKYITFDCYDTLVAYSDSKAAAIRNIVQTKGGDEPGGDRVVANFEAREREMHESADFEPLGVVLRTCLEDSLSSQGLAYEDADGDSVIQAVGDAVPFDDVAPTLARISDTFKLAILSNSEPSIISRNIDRIGLTFDQVVLAAEVHCYKPDLRMFHALLERCDCEAHEIVHVAQGFYHDIIPGARLGLKRVWINRNARDGDTRYGPYDELPDLTGLPALLGIDR